MKLLVSIVTYSSHILQYWIIKRRFLRYSHIKYQIWWNISDCILHILQILKYWRLVFHVFLITFQLKTTTGYKNTHLFWYFEIFWVAVRVSRLRNKLFPAASAGSWPLLSWLTLCDLFPGSVEMMAGGNLSDNNQHTIVSVLERGSGAMLSMVLKRLLRLCSLYWGSCCDGDFHGNSATSGRWALFHLHDNCIRSKHHDSAGRAGRMGGRGSVEGDYLIGSQVMWLYDVTAYHWTKGKEGYENLCWSYILHESAEADCHYW